VTLFLAGPAARAVVGDAGALPPAASAPTLRPLPVWEEPELARATPEELARVDAVIDQLTSPDREVRRQALQRVREVDESWLPAVAERYERLASGANKPALKVLLEKIRVNARRAQDSSSKREPSGGAPDTLELCVEHPERSSSFLRPLTEVLAYSRMFEAIATLPAARRLLSVYVRFGEFLRVDTVSALARMQDASIAALIEATGHPVPRIAEWAAKQLEDRGKLVASEAIQVQDPTYRADILRAYGKTRDVETAKLLISFAASERALIRSAARQAVTMLGEPGAWQLRDAYEKAVGQRAPREWPWQRLAQELFAEFDRQRLSDLYRLYDQGRAAFASGDLGAARALYDQVLAIDPLFERGADMAPVYVAFAEQQADSDTDAATLALRRAERLASSGPVHDRALSARLTLDARALAQRGIVDEVLVQRARELDPENRRAAALEEQLLASRRDESSLFRRYLGALVIALLALVGTVVVALRARSRRHGSPQAAAPSDLGP
jgi:hypothetical protein